MLCVERQGKLLLEQLVTEAKIPVVSYGMLSQKSIAKDIVIQTFGLHTKQLFQKNNIRRWARKQVKQLM